MLSTEDTLVIWHAATAVNKKSLQFSLPVFRVFWHMIFLTRPLNLLSFLSSAK